MTNTATASDLGVKIGTIFCASYGYDQTNINYYEVVGVTPSGKYVEVRRIHGKVVDGSQGYMSHTTVPDPGNFYASGGRRSEVTTHRLKDGLGKGAIRISSYCDAYVISPDAQSFASWWR
jgi:hypothetical protein